MDEKQWDKLLHIKTSGRDDSHSDTIHYPYEPTPYSVLERLVKSNYISKKDTIIDYGCGKGRVGFFLNHELKCSVVGIEFDERIYSTAEENKQTYKPFSKIEFIHTYAEQYQITNATGFYFFNPFSVEILKSVMRNILNSYYENPRQMKLFFYYPNDEYLAYLMNVDELMFTDEIDCRDLFDGENDRERILIFEIRI